MELHAVFFSFSESKQQWSELCELQDRWNTGSSRHKNIKINKIVTTRRRNHNAWCLSCISFNPFTTGAKIFRTHWITLTIPFLNSSWKALSSESQNAIGPIYHWQLVNSFPRRALGTRSRTERAEESCWLRLYLSNLARKWLSKRQPISCKL